MAPIKNTRPHAWCLLLFYAIQLLAPNCNQTTARPRTALVYFPFRLGMLVRYLCRPPRRTLRTSVPSSACRLWAAPVALCEPCAGTVASTPPPRELRPFVRSSGAFCTPGWLNGVLRRAALSVTGRIATPSLRIGFATAAAAAGVADNVIRVSGRWRGSSHLRYIRGPRLAVWEACRAIM